MDKTNGFKIQEEERQGWISIAMVWTGSVICVPALMIGGMLGAGLTLTECFFAILVGYGMVCVLMCFIGMLACDTGLPTAVAASRALGESGAKYVISLILAISCIGWFGIQAAVCGASFSSMFLHAQPERQAYGTGSAAPAAPAGRASCPGARGAAHTLPAPFRRTGRLFLRRNSPAHTGAAQKNALPCRKSPRASGISAGARSFPHPPKTQSRPLRRALFKENARRPFCAREAQAFPLQKNLCAADRCASFPPAGADCDSARP